MDFFRQSMLEFLEKRINEGIRLHHANPFESPIAQMLTTDSIPNPRDSLRRDIANMQAGPDANRNNDLVDSSAYLWEAMCAGIGIPSEILGIKPIESTEPFDVPDDHFTFKEDLK